MISFLEKTSSSSILKANDIRLRAKKRNPVSKQTVLRKTRFIQKIGDNWEKTTHKISQRENGH